MDLARSAPPQTGRTQQDDAAGSVRPQDESLTGPFANVLFREIHKNALLRKLTVEKRMGAFPKKGERVWVVFCVHDDSEPLLEIYNCKNKAVTHKPDWFVSLSNCLHVSPTICPQEDEYEFVITLSSDVVRLTAPSWDLMMEWVECISSKLREMHILSPRENVYSKNPETGPRLPLAPTRDPNSPLPPPPAGPATAVPGIEQIASTGGESSSTEQSHDSPNSSGSPSEDTTTTVQQLNYDDVTVQQRTCTTSLYITQSEPPVYTRSRHVLCRASSVPDSSSLNAFASSSVALRSQARDSHNSATDTDENVTVVRVNSEQVPLSAGYHPVAIFDFSTAATQMSGSHSESDNASGLVEPNEVSDTPPRNSTDAGQNIADQQREKRTHTNNVAPDVSDSSGSHYECVFLARTPAETATTLRSGDESPSQFVDSPLLASTLQDTVVPTDGYQRNGRIRAVSGSEAHALRPPLNPPAVEAASLQRASDADRQSTTSLPSRTTERQDNLPATSPRADIVRRSAGYSTNQSERQEALAGNTTRGGGSGLTACRPPERCETSVPGASVASPRAVVTSTGRTPERSDQVSASAVRGAEIERQLQPAPHPYQRQISLESGTSGNSTGAVSRMTLREQQVFQLRREMAHPGGVRLQLRRKDCVGSVALVDIFGSVWIAGWKQREHPMLYNALHIGDQLLTVVGVPVQNATDANRLIRGAMGLYVTTLVNTKGPSKKKKGRSKRAHVLVAAVEKATENFIEKGEMIAYENPDIKQEMLAAVEEVRKTGDAMSVAAREFADDPCSSLKRGNMVRAARNLLSAVTRLLILADMVDVHLLLKSLRVVEDDLEKLKNASSQSELLDNIKAFGRNASELMSQAAKRQQELKDPQLRDDLAAARAVLKKHSTMLLTASKVYVRHPELAAAKANRDYVFKQVCEAVNTISDVAQGKGPSVPQNPYDGPGELAAALDDFDEHIVIDPLTYNEVRTRPSLEERLESIISGAALMADSSCTRDERRERIVAECNAVRQALQDLLSEYMSNMGTKEQSEGLERALDHMCRKTRDLRRQLRKAVVDHVSDSFLETNVPLLVLIEAARAGNEKEVEEYALVFTEHANKLVEVANLACSMSGNEDGVKMVRYAAAQIENLCPQVINAARILAARPRSKVAQENMDVFRDAWENQVRILTEAVDDITTIDDFLAVSENHILEDVNKCVLALQEGDADTLDRTAGAIRGRSSRVCNVVGAEMDNYEPGIYTERVLEAVKVLRDQVMPNFAQRVEVAVDALSSNPPKDVDENEFIDASRLVYDGVREIRRAVLMNRTDEELDPEDVEFDEHYTIETRSKSSAHTGEHGVDEYPDISGITTAREAMRKMTEEDKQKIAQQVEYFRSEKLKFDREVAKWDDTGNDIIVLAKHMCMIMMEMTDFTRGRGPLKTTMDVINAAKKISEAGTKLDKLTRQIADQCPESSTKKDLLAYLQRIALYCHQMNITSKVKADVQNISGELIVSGLDSATSLIQAAKNLMNAVVLTVKASYVASTKYPRQGTVASPIVVWKMKAPEKKPLVRPEKPEEVRAKVRKGSQKKVQNPIKALSEFQSPTESI